MGLAGSEVIIQAEVCQAQREAEEPGYEAPGAGVIVGEGLERREAALRQQLRLRFTVPKGKVANLMGVMNFLQYKFNRLEVVLSAAGGWISEQDYEDKIREAFHQLGIEVVEE